jgi:hypothetical protein
VAVLGTFLLPYSMVPATASRWARFRALYVQMRHF